MRQGLAAALLVAMFVAGCGSKPDTEGERPTDGTIVHDIHGQVLPSSAGLGITFEQRYVDDELGWEPVIAVADDGTVLYPVQRRYEPPNVDASMHIMRSADDGLSWEEASPPFTKPFRFYEADPILHKDPTTGRIFWAGLSAPEVFPAEPLCSSISWTDDAGSSWTTHDTVCGGLSRDHQTVWSAASKTPGSYPSILFYCANSYSPEQGALIAALEGPQGPGALVCQASHDSGESWQTVASAFPTDDPCSSHLVGHGVSSRVTGTSFLPQGQCGRPVIATTDDGGQSWDRFVVSETVGILDHDIALAVDETGVLYAFWVDEGYQPRLAVSQDEARTWGPAFAVGVPGITVAAPMYTAIVAGGGHVAFFYIASNVTGGADASQADMDRAEWHMRAGFVAAPSAADPVVVTVFVNDPADPLRKGPCLDFCYSDQDGPTSRPASQEQFGMGDYIGAAIDPTTGYARVAFVDVCINECATAAGSVDSPEGARASLGVQTNGPRFS